MDSPFNFFMFEKEKKPRPKNTAYLYGIRILAKRDYSEVKLRQKMRDKKFEFDEIDVAVEQIKELGYLREDYYIEARIKGFMHKHYPPFNIQQRLRNESLEVPLEDIQAVFDEYKITERSQIEHLIDKKTRRGVPEAGTEEFFKFREKVLGSVHRKGHNLSLAKNVFDASLQEPS